MFTELVIFSIIFIILVIVAKKIMDIALRFVGIAIAILIALFIMGLLL
ncbi:hypothetical protein [Methanobrevibacter olleyae]|uniref:Uncharacterized protein n=1 Tax=Methanobrevibacter olleyae TaxID=294671 RepID=A0A126R1A3_METOL|nr:hypothetical protein [Methanobrevibacter olleyae]AMK16163.1 hypothetical protein YLM1_1608 [Methanobrevibacter olleyae]SFL31709.1 hypothetical protein SAMN02910297_00546 [Methanobrevibacter olleyae]